ncbi:hypothetical protein T440DRAFT_541598 [Plenodomus tracheiphilus IPT5]|uniref:Heterokaryon incompatibility domain-containing protein n=1 Tax=Plenodomus tracheiphilus IPT5 TaxID=1408161 RepID=A0A6A7AVU1_9PLEO|nr:hypothetical protein T440DRAFT_541598 [Plenodomus tracheiphilus IPT5]
MSLVYGNALLTIIAAPDRTEDASMGLAGHREPSDTRRQAFFNVRDFEFGVPKPCLVNLLSYTKWETRGWTFQESYLSRRSLYFTSQQLYFQCTCGIRCENTSGEGQVPSAFISHITNMWNPRNPHALDPEIDYGDLILSHTRYDSDQRALRSYDNFVCYYLRRELSFDSDILNAFQGIEQVFRKSMSSEFYAGLPVKWLDHALLSQLIGPG